MTYLFGFYLGVSVTLLIQWIGKAIDQRAANKLLKNNPRISYLIKVAQIARENAIQEMKQQKKEEIK